MFSKYHNGESWEFHDAVSRWENGETDTISYTNGKISLLRKVENVKSV